MTTTTASATAPAPAAGDGAGSLLVSPNSVLANALLRSIDVLRPCLAVAKRLDAMVLTADRAWTELDHGVEVRLVRTPKKQR
jgi:hypothetical protein